MKVSYDEKHFHVVCRNHLQNLVRISEPVVLDGLKMCVSFFFFLTFYFVLGCSWLTML